MKRIFFFLCCLCCMQALMAQSPYKRNQVAIGVGFSNWETWNMETAYTYSPNQYLGLTVGVEIAKAIHAQTFSGKVSGSVPMLWMTSNSYNDEENKTHSHLRFLLEPALTFSTPRWLLSEKQELYLSLSAIPGLKLTLPNSTLDVDYIPDIREGTVAPLRTERLRNTGGKWLFWNMGLALNLHLQEASFGLKYDCSNFDFWSDYRNIRIAGEPINRHLPQPKFAHAFKLYVAYNF